MAGSGRGRALRRRPRRGAPLLAGVIAVAAASLALTGCVPEDAVAGPTSSMRATTAPTATATPTPTPTPTPTATPTATATTPTDTRASTDVVIVTWNGGQGRVSASGLVPGVAEDGGTCTLTATSGAGTFTAARDAQQANGSTQCGVISIDVPAGDWTLSLSYDSTDAYGVSDPQTATAT